MKSLLRQFLHQFDQFNEVEIDAIVDHTQVETFKKGSIILREGDICRTCFFILKGCIRQFQLVKGEEKTTEFFTEGQAAVLYSSYLDQTPSQYHLSCVEDTILTTGTREQEQKLHREYPRLESMIFALMPQDLYKAQERISLLGNHPPEERYRILLKRRPELMNRVPLQQLASFIGVTPESFSRIRKRVAQKEQSH